jgi:hypothetical protein
MKLQKDLKECPLLWNSKAKENEQERNLLFRVKILTSIIGVKSTKARRLAY